MNKKRAVIPSERSEPRNLLFARAPTKHGKQSSMREARTPGRQVPETRRGTLEAFPFSVAFLLLTYFFFAAFFAAFFAGFLAAFFVAMVVYSPFSM